MEKLTGLCVLLAALSLAVTGKETEKNFKDGDSLTLEVRPAYSEHIINILWKFRGNLLAEWIEDKVPLEFYRSFKKRTTLDTENGRLVVNNMSENDTGVYSVEINSNLHSESYNAKWFKCVPQPVVVIITSNCTSSSDKCTVSCDGDTKDAEPVTYWWKMGDKDWEKGSGKNFEITRTKNGHDKYITCRMTNPVCEKVSETVPNPLYREDKPGPPVVGIVLGALVGVAVLLGVAVWLMWKLKKGPFKNRGTSITDAANKSPTPDEELKPLNADRVVGAVSGAVTGEKVTEKYFTEGDTLTLEVRPPYSDPITNILWKSKGDLLAKWIKDKVPLEFFRSFKGRTTLDTKNGRLVVNNMSKDDAGVYSVEINSNIHSESYKAKWIKRVPQPVVVITTSNCTPSSEVCTVSCDGDTREAEPVTYSWKMGDKDWEKGSGKNFEITRTKNGHDKNITCRMTNPVCEEVSETVPNPLYREEEKETS